VAGTYLTHPVCLVRGPGSRGHWPHTKYSGLQWLAPLWLPSGGRLMSGLGSGVVRPGIDSPAWLVQPLWRPEARDGTAGPAGKRRSHCDCLFGPSPPPPAPLERTLEGCCPVLVAADFTPSKLLQHEALTD